MEAIKIPEREKKGDPQIDTKTLTARFRVLQPIEPLCILVGAFNEAPNLSLFLKILVITFVISYRSIKRL